LIDYSITHIFVNICVIAGDGGGGKVVPFFEFVLLLIGCTGDGGGGKVVPFFEFVLLLIGCTGDGGGVIGTADVGGLPIV